MFIFSLGSRSLNFTEKHNFYGGLHVSNTIIYKNEQLQVGRKTTPRTPYLPTRFNAERINCSKLIYALSTIYNAESTQDET